MSSPVAGVTLSSPDKVLYEKAGLSKQGLAGYYEAVAEQMLPYVADRPLTLVRCPRGHTRNCFFQKHLGDAFHASVKPIQITEKKGVGTYAYVDSLQGLVGLVQMGTLEIHAWGSRIDELEKPDNLVFDLDPGEGIGWSQVKAAAADVRNLLAQLGLVSFVRTSGGKGLHVVAPLTRRQEWDEVKAFCQAVAQRMAQMHPNSYVATLSKVKRKNKIFIDYLRNSRGATSICNYSTRSKPLAPVATPLAWEELDDLSSPQTFRVDTLPMRLSRLGEDPWQGYHSLRQSLTRKAKRELGID